MESGFGIKLTDQFPQEKKTMSVRDRVQSSSSSPAAQMMMYWPGMN